MNDTGTGRDGGEKPVDLSALIAGDGRAVEQFVRRESGWMAAVCQRILRDESLAHDCVQNAFVSIFRNLLAFRGDARLKTWMYRIVVNQALMDQRKRKRLREEPIDNLELEFYSDGCRVELGQSPEPSPEERLDSKQTGERVQTAIDRLPENYRIVLLLRDIEELTTAETAEVLEMTENNVKVTLHRARAALKILLEALT